MANLEYRVNHKYNTAGVISIPLKGNAWHENDSITSGTSLTITKAASPNSIWDIKSMNVSATQPGLAEIKVNGVTKWQLRFAANKLLNPSFGGALIQAAINQPVSLVVTLDSSGDAFANLSGEDGNIIDARINT